MSPAARVYFPGSIGAYFCLLACREAQIPKRGSTRYPAWENFLPIAKAVLAQKTSSPTPSVQEAKIAGTVFHDF